MCRVRPRSRPGAKVGNGRKPPTTCRRRNRKEAHHAMPTPRKTARVIAYRRVSDTRGRDNLTSPRSSSRRSPPRWHSGQGWKIIHGPEEFKELDQSGGRLDRPMLQRAIQMVEHREADVIAVYMLSRFARSTAAAALFERVEAVGGEVLWVSEPALDGGTISGVLMRNLMLAIDQHQRDLSRVHRDNARERAINEGRHAHRPGADRVSRRTLRRKRRVRRISADGRQREAKPRSGHGADRPRHVPAARGRYEPKTP